MADPFDDVLNLEDRFYDEGYRQGVADGTRAGQSEGRTLGLEKGFQKFIEGGRLQGKAVIWASRLPSIADGLAVVQGGGTQDPEAPRLVPLPASARLQKNVRALYALVEPGTLSIANTDVAVNDVDDRVKRAQGKARVVEKLVGELAATAAASPSDEPERHLALANSPSTRQ